MGKRKRQTHLTFEPLAASGGIGSSGSKSQSRSSDRGNGGQVSQAAGGGQHGDEGDPFQDGSHNDETNNNDSAPTCPQPTPRKESNFAPANVRYSQRAVRVRTKPRLLVSDKNDRFDKARKKDQRLGECLF